MKIQFKDLKANSYNPRKHFRSASMEELKASIEKYGLIEPIVVRKKGQKYEVVAGMRRYHALKGLAVEEVECYLRELTDIEAIDISFLENTQRDNLTPIEDAKFYMTRLMTLNGFKEKYGKKSERFQISQDSKFIKELKSIYNRDSAKTMSNKLSLLNLPEDLQDAISTNFHDKDKDVGLLTYYGYQLARLPQEDILPFYERYYNDTRLKISEFSSKITELLEERKLEGERLRTTLELKLKKVEIELEKLNTNIDTLNDKMSKILLAIQEQYKLEDDLDIETAIDFLNDELAKFTKLDSTQKIAKGLRAFELKINDLDVLIERLKKENLGDTCPYCLGGISPSIIKKRRTMFKDDITELNNELDIINETIEFARYNNDHLIDYNKQLTDKKADKEIKEIERDEIQDDLSGI